MGFDYQTDNPNDVYVETNLENDTEEIIRYDFETETTLEKIFSDAAKRIRKS